MKVINKQWSMNVRLKLKISPVIYLTRVNFFHLIRFGEANSYIRERKRERGREEAIDIERYPNEN